MKKNKNVVFWLIASVLLMASCTENSSEVFFHYSEDEKTEVKRIAQSYGLDVIFDNNCIGDKLSVEDFKAIFEDIHNCPERYVLETYEINDSTLCVVYDVAKLVGVARVESQSEVEPFTLQTKSVGIYTISITVGVPNGSSAPINWVITDGGNQKSCSGTTSGSHNQFTESVDFSFNPQFITDAKDTVKFIVSDGCAFVTIQDGKYEFLYGGFGQYQSEDE